MRKQCALNAHKNVTSAMQRNILFKNILISVLFI